MLLTHEFRTLKALPKLAVVALKGAVDPGSVAALQESLEGQEGERLRILVLDLGGLRYICSAGIDYLVHLGDRLAARRGVLLLAATQPKVKIAFEFLGAARFFKQYRSVEAALVAVADARGRARKAPLRKQA